MDCEKEQTIGFEFEFDPNGQAVDKFVQDGGDNNEVGMDGGGGTGTIEIRLNPVDTYEPEIFSNYLDSIMDSLLSHQPRVLYGGCGRRLPIGTHVHVDLREKEIIRTVAHFSPLYAVLNSRINKDFLSNRLKHGYGKCNAIKIQGSGESVLGKQHLEYRGLPNMVKPFFMGFTYGWACRIYDKGVSHVALKRLDDAVNDGEPIDLLDTHTEWGFPPDAMGRSGPRIGGSLRKELEEYSTSLHNCGVGRINAYVMHNRRKWKAVYYSNGCVYMLNANGSMTSTYIDDLSDTRRKDLPEIIFSTESPMFLLRRNELNNLEDNLSKCLQKVTGETTIMERIAIKDIVPRKEKETRDKIISGYEAAIKD